MMLFLGGYRSLASDVDATGAFEDFRGSDRGLIDDAVRGVTDFWASHVVAARALDDFRGVLLLKCYQIFSQIP